jgi:hypothetical protein
LLFLDPGSGSRLEVMKNFWKLEQNSQPCEQCKNSEWLQEKIGTKKTQGAGCSSLEQHENDIPLNSLVNVLEFIFGQCSEICGANQRERKKREGRRV